MIENPKRRGRPQGPLLTVEQILAWADAHYEVNGTWPRYRRSGPIVHAPEESWVNVDAALREGYRGLPGGSSLPRLLAVHRGVRNIRQLPRLTIEQILAWADAYHQRRGQWPLHSSGVIPEAPEENWARVDQALRGGGRGLTVGGSLPRLLAEHRGIRLSRRVLPPLTQRQILAWADAYYQQNGRWPRVDSGPIAGTDGESWATVDSALYQGTRGLRGKSSLARLLAKKRGRRNRAALPRLTIPKILQWARAHRRRTGKWPKNDSGPIPEAPGETWQAVHMALVQSGRGLSGHTTLARLLNETVRRTDHR
jgi:hypothetical protein